MLAASEVTFARIEEVLRRCLNFADCHAAYLSAAKQIRRHMNQAVFERFLVGEDGSTEARANRRLRRSARPRPPYRPAGNINPTHSFWTSSELRVA